MSQISATPGITTTTLGDYIRKDGTTTTTARIPFALGLSVPTGDGSLIPPQSILIGTNPSPVLGATSRMIFATDDVTAGVNQGIIGFTAETNTAVTTGATLFFQGGDGPSAVSSLGGSFLMTAGRGFGLGGGSVTIQGGRDNTVAVNAGRVNLIGGASSAGNRGYVRIGTSGTPDKFSLASNNAQSSLYINQALEVDGAAFMDGALTVVGTTTLATSLDGLATLTAGVVGELNGVQGDLAYYSGSNTLTVLNKNTSATRYLSNTGSSNNPAWAQVDLSNGVTGTLPLSSTSLTVPDDVKFYIGDNSQAAGNVSFVNDQASTGNLLIAPENGFGGQIYFDGLSATIEDNFTTCVGTTNICRVGPTLTSPQATPSVDTHSLFVTKQESSTTGCIAGVFEAEFAGTSSSSSQIQALNVFSHTISGTTGDLTNSTNGGGLRSRVLTRQRGSGTIAQMSGYSLTVIQDASTGTVSLGTPLNVESPTIGLGSTMTEWRGINFDVPAAVSGTVGTAKFMHVPSLTGTFGTTQMEVFLDADAGLFFRASTQQISSPSAGIIQYDTATRHDFNSTVRVNSLTASRVVTTDASRNLASLTPSSAYTPTNVTTDRSYDADSTKVDELADVLGTLIADLQTAGILG